MSSIAKSGISLSKKDLTKSRIPLVASRNVTFYHKANGGELSIDLLALSMPSEMPTNVQATVAEISGAQLAINKKNLTLQSSANGVLQQGLHYVVTSSTTIQLIGLYTVAGAEIDEIFTGTINSAPISDLVVASAKSVDKTYTLAVGSTTLNLGREYKVGSNPFESIGSIKVFVNGVLALRGSDYTEVDSGNGYGTTIQFYTAPVSIPHQIAVDFGVMAITDNNAIGAIENLGGAIKKIADDLAVVAGTAATDYYTASPSEVERRAFGDSVLSLNSKYDTAQNLSAYTRTRWQEKILASSFTSPESTWTSIVSFNNLSVGKKYKISMNVLAGCPNSAEQALVQVRAVQGVSYSGTGSVVVAAELRVDNTPSIVQWHIGESAIFECSSSTLSIFVWVGAGADSVFGNGTKEQTWFYIEELPNHEITTAWT